MEVVIEAISGSQNTANFDSQSNTSHTFLGSNKFVWTKPPKNNLQNRPKEWKNKYLPISFCKEENEAHSIILKNILLQDKNPEQPIPRLIELTKFLLEWAAPKGTSYSNKEVKDKFKNIKIQLRYLAKKMASEIDISVVVLPMDEQVEQEIMKDLESLQQDDCTSDEQ
ncbi:hypothetical protein BY996DRAFT_6410618 [Phakopsora pachyrhizi]|nr:hypothetical protein BY996DRAFT_6410618 [Phakopsora pachyrhizi]